MSTDKSSNQNRRPKDVKGPTSSQQAQNYLLQRAANSDNANSLLNAFSKFKMGNVSKEEDDDTAMNQDFQGANFKTFLKHLNKKDSTTRQKALQNIINELNTNTEVIDKILSQVLPEWIANFKKLTTDNDRRVREVHKEFSSIAKKEMAPFLKESMGYWLSGMFDTEKEVRQSAVTAFESTFQPDKRKAAIQFCESSILEFISINLQQTVQTLSDLKQVSQNEAEEKYSRVICGSIFTLKFLLEQLQGNPSQDWNKYEQIMDSKFWKQFLGMKNYPLIRSATFALVTTCCIYAPKIIENNLSQISPIVLGSFSEVDTNVHYNMIEALITLLKTFHEKCWQNVNTSKAIFPKLWSFLKNPVSVSITFDALLPFLSFLNFESLGGSYEKVANFFEDFFNNMWIGFENCISKPLVGAVVEGAFIFRALNECLFYIFGNTSKYVPNDRAIELQQNLYEKFFLKKSISFYFGVQMIHKQSEEKNLNLAKLSKVGIEYMNSILLFVSKLKQQKDLKEFALQIEQYASEIISSNAEETIELFCKRYHLFLSQIQSDYASLCEVEWLQQLNTQIAQICFSKNNATIPFLIHKLIEFPLFAQTYAKDRKDLLHQLQRLPKQTESVSSLALYFCIFADITEEELHSFLNDMLKHYSNEEMIHFLNTFYSHSSKLDQVLVQFIKERRAYFLVQSAVMQNYLSTNVMQQLIPLLTDQISEKIGQNTAELQLLLEIIRKNSQIIVSESTLQLLVDYYITCSNDEMRSSILEALQIILNQQTHCNALVIVKEKLPCSIPYDTFFTLIQLLSSYTTNLYRSVWQDENIWKSIFELVSLQQEDDSIFEYQSKQFILKQLHDNLSKQQNLFLFCQSVGVLLKCLQHIENSDSKSEMIPQWQLQKLIFAEFIISQQKDSATLLHLLHSCALEHSIWNIHSKQSPSLLLQSVKGMSNSVVRHLLCKTWKHYYSLHNNSDAIYCTRQLFKLLCIEVLFENTFEDSLSEPFMQFFGMIIQSLFADCSQKVISFVMKQVKTYLEKELEESERKSVEKSEDWLLRILSIIVEETNNNSTRNPLIIFQFATSLLELFLHLHPTDTSGIELDSCVQIVKDFCEAKLFSSVSKGMDVIVADVLLNLTIKLDQFDENTVSVLHEWKQNFLDSFLARFVSFTDSWIQMQQLPIVDYLQTLGIVIQICKKEIHVHFLATLFYHLLSLWKENWNKEQFAVQSDFCDVLELFMDQIASLFLLETKSQIKSLLAQFVMERDAQSNFQFSDQLLQFLFESYSQSIPLTFFSQAMIAYTLIHTNLHGTSSKHRITHYLEKKLEQVNKDIEKGTDNLSEKSVLHLKEEKVRFATLPVMTKLMNTSPFESTIKFVASQEKKLPSLTLKQVYQFLPQHVDDLESTSTMAYFYNWLFLLSFSPAIASASITDEDYSRAIYLLLKKRKNSFKVLMDIIFCVLLQGVLERRKEEQQELWIPDLAQSHIKDQQQIEIPLFVEQEEEIHISLKLLCGQILFMLLKQVPSLVRMWYKEISDNSLIQYIDKYFSQQICSWVIEAELESIKLQAKSKALPNHVKVKVFKSLNQVTTTYEQDEVSLDLTITIPELYPLRPLQIKSSKQSGVSESMWKNWMLKMNSFLFTQSGNVFDAIMIWKSNLDKHFEGVEPCPICYSIVLTTDHSLPKVKCRVCKNKFHGACIYKWLNTSGNNTCPMCRSAFVVAD